MSLPAQLIPFPLTLMLPTQPAVDLVMQEGDWWENSVSVVGLSGALFCKAVHNFITDNAAVSGYPGQLHTVGNGNLLQSLKASLNNAGLELGGVERFDGSLAVRAEQDHSTDNSSIKEALGSSLDGKHLSLEDCSVIVKAYGLAV